MAAVSNMPGVGFVGSENGYAICQMSHTDEAAWHVMLPMRNGHAWCDNLAEVLEHGDDAILISSAERVNVPIAPLADIWAVVYIDGGTELANGACMMYLEYQPDLGRQRSEYLGYWNPGEGRDAMKRVIVDWWKAQLDPAESWADGSIMTKCPASVHGLKQSKQLQKITSGNERLKCLWNIVMERACTPCIVDTGNPDQNQLPF